ncbi:MAG TPA: response regulator transcription factor [Thermoanaerobaculia bacterium]|nr:response regulator transcription factor [Thermoanaerobaculia bacterium]
MAKPVGVMIVGPDRLLGDVVVGWLASLPDFQVIDPAAPPRPGGVDVVLLAAGRRRDEALAAAWRVGEELPGARLLVFGLPREDDELLDFVEAGALGYLLEKATSTDLIAALHDLLAGRTHCAPHIAAAVLGRIERHGGEKAPPVAGPREPLTVRELGILRLLASGLSNKEIGQHLGISLSTVKNHVHNLLGKLAVLRRRDAVRLAYASGLLPDLLDGPRRSATGQGGGAERDAKAPAPAPAVPTSRRRGS